MRRISRNSLTPNLTRKYAEFASFDYDLIVVQQDEPLWTDQCLANRDLRHSFRPIIPSRKDERFTVYSRRVP